MNELIDPSTLSNVAVSERGESGSRQALVRLRVESKNIDSRSHQFECTVGIENPGAQRLRIISLRALTPLGEEIQQESDTSQSDSRVERDKLYRDLSRLISDHLIESSAQYRNKVVQNMMQTLKDNLSVFGILGLYFQLFIKGPAYVRRRLSESQRAWWVRIRNSARAQFYYDQFLKPHETAYEDLCKLYVAKLEDVRQVEAELGDSIYDESIADIEPGGTFSRAYVFNCTRRLLNPRTYTFSFDCAFNDRLAPSDHRHLSASISAIISPKPFVLNLLAVGSAGLGSSLKIFLDLTVKKTDLGVAMSTSVVTINTRDLINTTTCETLIAAMITGLFFYNIYESTEIGKRLSVGVGWRSALIIGGLSGLLNQKVIAALQGLLG